ncbi:MAG: ATP-binding protein, partial [Trueperaceae bacterium]
LTITDDGVGFDPTASYPGHLGLRSMHERVASLEGRLDITSAVGHGTTVRVQVPLKAPGGARA